MVLRIRTLHRACYVVLLVLLLGRMYDNCELDNSGIKIVINETCGWSDWLSWSCTCCSENSTRPFAVRKRAICCSGSTTVEECINHCGYEEHSDTMYGNCSTDNCEGAKCGETIPPSIDSLSLPHPTKAFASSSSPTMSESFSSVSSLSSSSTRAASTSSSMSLSSDSIMPTTHSTPTSSLSVLSMSTTSSSTTTTSSSNSLSALVPITHDSFVPVPSRIGSTTVSESDSSSITHSTNQDKSEYSRHTVHTSTYVPRNETSEALNKTILTEATSHVGVILGAVVGSVVALGAVAVVLYFLKRAKKTANTATVHPDIENQPTESNCELDTVNM